MTAVARAVAAVALFSAAGCFWSRPPAGPHGHVALDGAGAPSFFAGEMPRLRADRIVVVGRFETVATQPVGGTYDWADYSTTPLYRTYFSGDAPLELFEHTCDGLRAAGLDARKDYATSGAPEMLEPALRQRDPRIVRGLVTALQHDQIRTDGDPPEDIEVLRVAVRVTVLTASGERLYEREHVVYGRVPVRPVGDVLRLAGLDLASRLARDDAFARAVAR